MKRLLIYLFSVTAALSIHAQDPDLTSKLPPGPLIQKRAPGYARWTITQQPTKSAGATPLAPKPKTSLTITITKTGNILLQEFLDPTGRSWATWYPNFSTGYILWPDHKTVMAQGPSTDGSLTYIDFSHTDFPQFDWLTKESFSGIKSMSGKSCLTFQGQIDLSSGKVRAARFKAGAGPNSDSSNTVIAYVEVSSRLPVAMQAGTTLSDYEFLAPPSTMLELPQPVRDAIAGRQKSDRSMVRAPIQPF
jgi:hypothetical protein